MSPWLGAMIVLLQNLLWDLVAFFTKGKLSPCQPPYCWQYFVDTHANYFILESDKNILANNNSGYVRPGHGEVVSNLAH